VRVKREVTLQQFFTCRLPIALLEYILSFLFLANLLVIVNVINIINVVLLLR
jgi:hypothetical protein